MNNYWETRKECNYYKKVIEIINEETILRSNIGSSVASIIDIGCANTEILKNFNIKDKACLDFNKLPETVGVRTIKCDFYKWVPDKKYDIVMCLQVLEHLDRPKEFANKLFELSNGKVIISVPYKWKKGFCIHHVQDPVDETKLFEWTQRVPSESYIIEDNSVKRIICVYNL